MTPRHVGPGAGRRRLAVGLAVAAAALLCVSAAGYAALHSRLLSATTVVVTGARHETPRQIIDAGGLANAPTMLSVNPGLVTLRIERVFPWVQSAVVTKQWPHTVRVSVTERRAVAVVPGKHGTTVLVDVTGRRLGPPGRGEVLPHLEYVVAPGQDALSPSTLSASATPGLLVAATLPPAFRYQVAVIQVNDAGWVTLHLTTPVSFVLGPASDLGQKYEDVAAVIAKTTLHAGDVVDVSVPQAMTVTGP